MKRKKKPLFVTYVLKTNKQQKKKDSLQKIL